VKRTVDRYDEVVRVLDDPAFLVPPAPAGEHGIAWLRSSVSRFSNGVDHARRRAHVERLLASTDPGELRVAAAELTHTVLDRSRDGTIDVMSQLARPVPIDVLARALAVEVDVDDVAAAAAAYPPGGDSDVERRGGEAVERLFAALGERNEDTVARATLLLQACEATAGLIGNAVDVALRLPQPLGAVDDLLLETLRARPPVRATRRVDAGGDALVLDLEAANGDPDVFGAPHRFQPGRPEQGRHLTFGHGFRACPGTAQALALAAGVVEPVLQRCELAGAEVAFAPSAALRVPLTLVVAVGGPTRPG
jgi:cytochrome P450